MAYDKICLSKWEIKGSEKKKRILIRLKILKHFHISHIKIQDRNKQKMSLCQIAPSLLILFQLLRRWYLPIKTENDFQNHVYHLACTIFYWGQVISSVQNFSLSFSIFFFYFVVLISCRLYYVGVNLLFYFILFSFLFSIHFQNNCH